MARKIKRMKLFMDMEINTQRVIKAKKSKTREGYRSLAEAYNKNHGRNDNKYISVSLDGRPDEVCLYCTTYDHYLEWKAKQVKHSMLIGEIKKSPSKDQIGRLRRLSLCRRHTVTIKELSDITCLAESTIRTYHRRGIISYIPESLNGKVRIISVKETLNKLKFF